MQVTNPKISVVWGRNVRGAVRGSRKARHSSVVCENEAAESRGYRRRYHHTKILTNPDSQNNLNSALLD